MADEARQRRLDALHVQQYNLMAQLRGKLTPAQLSEVIAEVKKVHAQQKVVWDELFRRDARLQERLRSRQVRQRAAGGSSSDDSADLQRNVGEKAREEAGKEAEALGVAAAGAGGEPLLAAPSQHAAAAGGQLPQAAAPDAESPAAQVPALGAQHAADGAEQDAAALAAAQLAQREWARLGTWVGVQCIARPSPAAGHAHHTWIPPSPAALLQGA